MHITPSGEKNPSSLLISSIKFSHILCSTNIVYGLTRYMNVTFTKTCIILLISSNLFVLFLILKLSGDIHPNPGPQSDSLLSSNIPTVFLHNLNNLHLNIQSILPKMDLLEVEVQNYDILVFTETWLSPQSSNDDLLLKNFDPPYRQDRHARVGGDVAIYIASGNHVNATSLY